MYLILVVKSIDYDFLEESESFNRINPHIDLFSASVLVGLFAYLYFPSSFTYRRPRTEENFHFPEPVDDSLWRIASSGHPDRILIARPKPASSGRVATRLAGEENISNT